MKRLILALMLIGSVGYTATRLPNSGLANMTQSTFKGRAASSGTGVPVDLSATQATAILNTFTQTLKGLVPAPSTLNGYFLKDDGTWAAAGGLSDGDKGDVTVSGTGATFTIDSGVVTNAKQADMTQATIKGRASGAGTGAPTDLTATQATAILNAFTGDSGSGGLKGLVPAPSSGDASKVLTGDGNWTSSSITAPRSYIWVDGGNGHGGSSSGEDKIRNYSNVRVSTGTAITRTARTTTAGDKYTINEDGLYTLTVADTRSSGNENFGFSVNVSSTTTNITSLTYANGYRGTTFVGTGEYASISVTLYLASGDVVRVHDDGGLDGNSARTFFTIVKVNN